MIIKIFKFYIMHMYVLILNAVRIYVQNAARYSMNKTCFFPVIAVPNISKLRKSAEKSAVRYTNLNAIVF